MVSGRTTGCSPGPAPGGSGVERPAVGVRVPSSAFRHALALLLVTFVNRMASIALSLLPALLVAREVGPGEAAVAYFVLKLMGYPDVKVLLG